MFIYSDIIEDQIVGDTKAKLLDTLSLKGSRDEVVTIEVENPKYVNLGKSETFTGNFAFSTPGIPVVWGSVVGLLSPWKSWIG
jgi:hypothetical protein